MKKINLVGLRFGKLTVLSESIKNKSGHIKWLCKCGCGNEKIIDGHSLRSGKTKSCGCYASQKTKERNYKHGYCKERLYKIWWGIKMRTCNEKRREYKYYGGRGIIMCDEWLNNYLAFRKWAISNGYKDNLSIDRIDVDGNYCSDNCRWTDNETQANNMTTNHLLKFNGRTQNITQWSKELGINRLTISARVNRGKLSDQEALSQKSRK